MRPDSEANESVSNACTRSSPLVVALTPFYVHRSHEVTSPHSSSMRASRTYFDK
jgi:hypothetical protein